MAQFLDDAQVIHNLLDGHLVEGCDFEIALISVGLADDLAADDEEQGEAGHPAHFGGLAEGVQRHVRARLVQVARLSEDVDIVEEPVEQVEASRDNVGNFQETVGIALVDDLDALELEE